MWILPFKLEHLRIKIVLFAVNPSWKILYISKSPKPIPSSRSQDPLYSIISFPRWSYLQQHSKFPILDCKHQNPLSNQILLPYHIMPMRGKGFIVSCSYESFNITSNISSFGYLWAAMQVLITMSGISCGGYLLLQPVICLTTASVVSSCSPGILVCWHGEKVVA